MKLFVQKCTCSEMNFWRVLNAASEQGAAGFQTKHSRRWIYPVLDVPAG